MKIGFLIVEHYDIGYGSSENELDNSLNVKQLEEISEKLNKKFGYSSETNSLSFSVKVIDTKKVKTSLSRKEINSLWN